MFRKFLKIAVLPALLGVWACSGDKTSGVSVEDNAITQGELHSSSDAFSSSSELNLSSSEIPSSSSIEYSSSVESSSSQATIPFKKDLWDGSLGSAKVNTESENSGYWFTWADDADGGTSKILFPVEMGNEYSDYSFDAVVEHCGGFCGTIVFGTTLEPIAGAEDGVLDPFVGVGFLVADEGKTADISSWGGLCVTYTSEVPLRVSIVSEYTNNSGLNSMPQISLPSTVQDDAPAITNFSEPTITQCARWHDFSCSPQSSDTLFGDNVVVKAKALVFKFVGSSSEMKKFNIKAIGTYDENLPQVFIQSDNVTVN